MAEVLALFDGDHRVEHGRRAQARPAVLRDRLRAARRSSRPRRSSSTTSASTSSRPGPGHAHHQGDRPRHALAELEQSSASPSPDPPHPTATNRLRETRRSGTTRLSPARKSGGSASVRCDDVGRSVPDARTRRSRTNVPPRLRSSVARRGVVVLPIADARVVQVALRPRRRAAPARSTEVDPTDPRDVVPDVRPGDPSSGWMPSAERLAWNRASRLLSGGT